MLALTRKRGESIMIGDDVEIILISISGEQARLGIVAPRHISVHRKEIYEAIQQENKEAQKYVSKHALKNLTTPE